MAKKRRSTGPRKKTTTKKAARKKPSPKKTARKKVGSKKPASRRASDDHEIDGPMPSDEPPPVTPAIPTPVIVEELHRLVAKPTADFEREILDARVGKMVGRRLIAWLGVSTGVLALLATLFGFLLGSHVVRTAEETAKEQTQLILATMKSDAERAVADARDATTEARVKVATMEGIANSENERLQTRLARIDETLIEAEQALAATQERSETAMAIADDAHRQVAAVEVEASRVKAELEGTDVEKIRDQLREQPIRIAELLKEDEDFVETLAGVLAGVPIGTIVPSVVASERRGWLEADGRALPISEYKQLYRVIGRTFNRADDGDGVFRLPDLTMRALIGTDGRIGEVVGSATHAHDMQHSHTVPGRQLAIQASGTTGEGRYTRIDQQWHGRGSKDNHNAERDGFLVYRTSEDTGVDSKAQHVHSVSVSGNASIPRAETTSTRAETSAESSYQPSMKVRMLIKAE